MNKNPDWSEYRKLALRFAKILWHSITHRFWYKLLSVVIAVFVWSYALSSNPTLLRDKWLDVDIRVTGQSVFSARRLSLLTDITENLPQARVRVAVPQQNYESVTVSNVSVELDLSTIHNKGKQVAKLRASTVLGSVLSIQPETFEFEVDQLDQRNVPVNVIPENKQNGYRYDIMGWDPARITVSGPASIVRQIAAAKVAVDLENITSSQNLVLTPILTDNAGAVVDETLLSIPASTVTVNYEIYPQKSVPVVMNMDEMLTGELPNGYEVQSIEGQPDTITIAAEQEILDNITEISLKPVDVSRATRSFYQNTAVNPISGVRKYSSDYVNVKVNIAEKIISRTFTNNAVALHNIGEGLRTKWSNPRVKIVVDDLFTIVNRLDKSDLTVMVDLSEVKEPGEYELPITVRLDNYPELSYSVEPATAKVTVTAK